MADKTFGYAHLAPGSTQAGGELAERLAKNFDRLERPDYEPRMDYISPEWPGDFPGRVILSLSLLTTATGRAPKFLEAMVDLLPRQINEKGYLGPANPDLVDEQQWSGHGWMISGLVEYWRLTGRQPVLDLATRMTEGLFLPVRGRLHTYPRRPEERVFQGSMYGTITNLVNGWRLSSDIGCAFIGLEGLVQMARVLQRADLNELIAEMHAAFEQIDLIAVSAQLHASLTAARMFLQHYDSVPEAAYLTTARRVYQLFRENAITENYANYNWFRRPTWTEPCAIVDAFILAYELWRHTGDVKYLDDAHHIYFNAICFAQKPHGGFGCDNCVGSEATYLEPTNMFDVVGCCNMRGSVGLAHVASGIFLQDADSVVVPLFFDARAGIQFSDGTLKLRQETAYPLEGRVKLTVEASSLTKPRRIRLFVPPWVDRKGLGLKVNGQSTPGKISRGFVEVKAQWQTGDVLELTFPIALRTARTINPNTLKGLFTYRHGPLLLGVYEGHGTRDRVGLHLVAPGRYQAEGNNAIELYPLTDAYRISEAAARKDRKKILFR